MEQKPTIVSFVRRQLKLKGKSQHSGRGFYECSVDTDMPYHELLNKFTALVKKWEKEGLVERKELINGKLTVVLRGEHFDQYYRTLVVSEYNYTNYREYNVYM